jgi:catechol 2,3-dioxygenase
MRDQDTEALPSSRLVDGIERVELRVQDIARSVAFYRDVVGLQVEDGDSVRATVRGPGGGSIFALDSSGVSSPADRRATGLFHTAIRYPSRQALGEALARAIAARLEIGAGDHGVSEALYVDDPDGNGVELYRDRPREQWPEPRPGQRVWMGTEPVDFDGLLREVGHRDPGGEPAPEGTVIGHVHLQVAELNRTITFYEDAVGLDLMMTLGDQAAFFSSHGYHHHIGANTWNSRAGGPASRGHAGLERVTLAVSSRDELERLRARLDEAGHDYAQGTDLETKDPDGIRLGFTLAE